MDHKFSYRLLRILGAAGLVLMLAAGFTGETKLGVAGVAAIFLGVGQTALFFNCPHCKRSLKPSHGLPDKCPYCKKSLK